MQFEEILEKVTEALRAEQRISYRALRRRFGLEDEDLEDLKEELIEAKRVAMDERGRVLVWAGDDRSRKSTSAMAPDSHAPAERRQLTVLFCDLADSTRLAARLDPEQLREIVLAYQSAVVATLGPYQGHVAQYLGDGVLVYFGYPVAHENDAERAVQAGIDLLQATADLARQIEQSHQAQIAVRIGVHTGMVVVGDVGAGGRSEQIALGETPNIAARLQALAGPNCLLIGDTTHRLVEGLFECASLGPQQLKGITGTIEAFEVVGRGATLTRFQVALREGLSPLLGRNSELEILKAEWEQACSGRACTTLVIGDAGIGKSRLLQELAVHVQGAGGSRIELRCAPFRQGSSLYPVITWLADLFGFRSDEDQQTKVGKMESALAPFEAMTPERIALIGSLLSLPPELLAPLELSAQRRRQLVMESLIDLFRERARRGSVLAVWEDLHWIDPTSLEFLGRLVDVAIPGVMLLLASRPTAEQELPEVREITLGNLSMEAARGLIESIAPGVLPDALVREIAEKSDGVPLFVEELTKSAVLHRQHADQGAQIGDPIPTTLRDALMSRLDRLTVGKSVAQFGSAFGREFPRVVVQAAWDEDPARLETGLRELLGAGMLRRINIGDQEFYSFKHALIRDAAYESVLRSTRQNYHQRIARAMERDFSWMVDSQPEVLAHHYTVAGCLSEAIGYWKQSGDNALRQSAHREAVSHLQQGIDLLRQLPAGEQRVKDELAFLLRMGGSMIALEGHGAESVGELFGQADRLCDQVPRSREHFDAIQGLNTFYLVRGDLQRALELSRELETLAGSLGTPAFILESSLRHGICLSVLGELKSARGKFEQVLSIYDADEHGSHRFLYGQDPQVSCLCHLALALCLLGYPDRALERARAACELAEELAHPFTLSWAYLYTALVHYLRRESEAVGQWAERLATLSTEQAFAYRMAQAQMLAGWADESPQQGAERVAAALSALLNTGVRVYAPFYKVMLAETQHRAGLLDQALETTRSGIELADSTREAPYRPELHRLQGILLMAQGEDKAAAERMKRAFELARAMGAESLALRAALDLHRLIRDDDSRAQLQKTFAGFSEGFNTRDLKAAAKALA